MEPSIQTLGIERVELINVAPPGLRELRKQFWGVHVGKPLSRTQTFVTP